MSETKTSKKVWLIVTASILTGLLLTYSILSTILLYIAVNNEEKWDIFKDTFFASKSKIADRDLGNIVTGTVELTMPKEFVALMGEDYDYILTEEQKENGFTSVKRADDGSAIFTIKKEDYDKFIKDLQKTTVEAINDTAEMISEQGDSSIKNIKYSQDFEQIIVYADKAKFNESFDNLYIYSVGLTACMYQMFDINSKGKCTIDITDKETKEVFKTVIYPDEFD